MGREMHFEAYLNTLYKLDALNHVRYFRILIAHRNNQWFVCTKKGVLGGAEQEDYEEVSIKNEGKANERDGRIQALVQANSKYNKVLDKGYKEIPEEVKENGLHHEFLSPLKGTDASGDRLVMLAQKDVSKIKLPGYLQRKYDGVRSKILRKNGKPIIKSRRGKLFTGLDHLLESIPWNDLNPDWELDGELYIHGKPLQDIVSFVKRNQERSQDINFRFYDLINTGFRYSDRLDLINEISDNCGESIKAAETYVVKDWDRITYLFNKFKREGYEGAMWRDPNGLYEEGKRSWGLIKIKDFMEEEFEVIDVEEATGRDKGTAVFVCKTEDGKSFNCRPMGTFRQRKEYLDQGTKLIGKMLTVRFQNYTKDGIPFHLRGVVIRDYE